MQLLDLLAKYPTASELLGVRKYSTDRVSFECGAWFWTVSPLLSDVVSGLALRWLAERQAYPCCELDFVGPKHQQQGDIRIEDDDVVEPHWGVMMVYTNNQGLLVQNETFVSQLEAMLLAIEIMHRTTLAADSPA